MRAHWQAAVHKQMTKRLLTKLDSFFDVVAAAHYRRKAELEEELYLEGSASPKKGGL